MARGKRRGGGRQRQTQRQLQQQQRQRGVTNNNNNNSTAALEHFLELIKKAQAPFDILEAVMATPPVWEDCPCRWMAFSYYYEQLGGILDTKHCEISGTTRVVREDMKCEMPNEKAQTTLQARFVDNEEEPILFRAHASFLLAIWSFRDFKDDDASEAVQRCLSLIQELSSSDGQRPMENHFGPTRAEATVQELLDRLQEDCQTLMGWIEYGPTGRTRATLYSIPREITKHSPIWYGPPKIDSKLINHIASFPEKDVVWFVRGPENYSEYGFDDSCNCYSQVFKFDLERFESGSEDAKKIFRKVSVVSCSGSDARAKKLLSVFSGACLHLHYRPRGVLFETLEDANQQTTKQMLELMGIDKECVGVLDTRAQKLIEINFPVWITEKDWSRKKTPHVFDFVHGTFCGSCGALGQNLLECSCGKAYYCNTTCQRAKWKEHKKQHDEIIAKMEKKNDA